MKTYLVSYDIFDPKRLKKVAKIVEQYKLKGQKSSWESPLDYKSMRGLIESLEEVLKEEDRINIIEIVGKPILLGVAKSIENNQGGIVIL